MISVQLRLLTATLAMCLAISACTPGGDLPPLPASAASTYTLGPGDRLRVITYGEDQLTGDFTVNDSGSIEVPLLGSVHAQGITVSELQADLTSSLQRRGLLRTPSVSVEVSTYRPIFALGEVTKPGPYPYQPHMSVITAIAVAGGFTYRAVKSRVSITRSVDGLTTVYQATPESTVAPGDVINVFERSF